MPHALVASIDMLLAFGGLVLTALLFRASLPPRAGGTRWFIGTRWEPYVAVFLVCGMVVSFGFLALSIVDLVVS
jgi:hypothetical protein